MVVRQKLLRTRSATGAAFVLTVSVALAPLFLGGQMELASARGLGLTALALAYMVCGLFDEELLGGDTPSAWRRGCYFALQTALVAGICVTSRLAGMAALCLLPLVSHSVAALRGLAAAGMVAVVYGVYLGTVIWLSGGRGLLGNALSMLAGFAFVVVFTRIAVREKEARGRAEILSEELASANARLRDYAARVEDLAMVRERNRVAREIHDSLGHYLTTVTVQLEAARALHATDPARSLNAVAKAHTLAQEALLEVRRSVSALRAEAVDRPLLERLRELAAADPTLATTVTLLGEPRPLGPEVAHGLYRSVQEGLTNIRKHARARTAEVALDYRDAAHVRVSVIDDGQGAAGRESDPPGQGDAALAGADPMPAEPARPVTSPSAVHAGFGLRGVRERVELLGGRCTAGPRAGGGFALAVEVPA